MDETKPKIRSLKDQIDHFLVVEGMDRVNKSLMTKADISRV